MVCPAYKLISDTALASCMHAPVLPRCMLILFPTGNCKASLPVCSNVLPMEVDIQRDFFTESSPSALRAVFSSWSLEACKQWCASCAAECTSRHLGAGQACQKYTPLRLCMPVPWRRFADDVTGQCHLPTLMAACTRCAATALAK